MQSIWVRKCARFLYAVCTIVCSTFGTHEFSPIKKISTEFTVEESGQKFADLELLCFIGETIFFCSFFCSWIGRVRIRYYACSKCLPVRTEKRPFWKIPFGSGKTFKIDAVLRKHYENWCSSRALLSSAPYTHWSWITYPRNKFLLAKVETSIHSLCNFICVIN